jgi:DNA repair protein RadC
MFHPRDLFREAIRNNSTFIILAHNHPSKQVLPSEIDIKMTKRVIKMGQLLELPVLDHVIFSDEKFFSFKDENQI